MKAAVYCLGQFVTYTGYSSKILYACAGNALQSTEMLEQCLSALGTQAVDILQRRLRPFFCALRAVTADGETVGFVTNLQDQVKS